MNRIGLIISITRILLLMSCSKKGTDIIEPKFGTYTFTTYTVDTFRIRIMIGEEILTDSLLSPSGTFSKIIRFYNSPTTSLKIIDTKNNQTILDSSINLNVGTSTISLVQFNHGEKPYIPGLPNEPAPAAGSYKIRFQYSKFQGDEVFPPQDFFYDSIRCIIRKNGIDIDTLVLKKYEMTDFYEALGSGRATFSVSLENPENNEVIDVSTSPTIGESFDGFNTVAIYGRTMVDDWRLKRIY